MSGQKASQPTMPLKRESVGKDCFTLKSDSGIVAEVPQDTLSIKSAVCSFFLSTFFEKSFIAKIVIRCFHGRSLPTMSMQNSCVLVASLARPRPPARSRPRSCVLAHTVSAATVTFRH